MVVKTDLSLSFSDRPDRPSRRNTGTSLDRDNALCLHIAALNKESHGAIAFALVNSVFSTSLALLAHAASPTQCLVCSSISHRPRAPYPLTLLIRNAPFCFASTPVTSADPTARHCTSTVLVWPPPPRHSHSATMEPELHRPSRPHHLPHLFNLPATSISMPSSPQSSGHRTTGITPSSSPGIFGSSHLQSSPYVPRIGTSAAFSPVLSSPVSTSAHISLQSPNMTPRQPVRE